MELFESRGKKKAKRDLAIRMGKKKVQQYVHDCRRMAGRYNDLAKKALALNETMQCDQYLYQRLQYERQANKWDAFLLKMEDLSLRGQMSGAMTSLVQGMKALTKEIRAGASPKEIEETALQLSQTMSRLEQTEEQMTQTMEGLDLVVGTPTSSSQDIAVPEEIKGELERLRGDLQDELVVQEKTSGSVVTSNGGQKTGSVDSRIQDGMDRINELKKKIPK